MDVLETERYKKTIRLGVTLSRTKFGKRASVDSIHDELINHKSQTVQSIVGTISILYDAIPVSERWQRKMVKELGEFTLWCMIHHPDYRNILIKLSDYTLEDGGLSFDEPEWMFSKVDIYFANVILKYTYKILSEKWYFKEQLKDIVVFSNPSARYIYTNICKAIDDASVKNSDILKVFAGIMLWVATHDTAYSDIFYWGIYNLGNEETRKITAVHYVPLENLYIVNYHKGNVMTDTLRKEGKISQNDRALPNKYCVQRTRFNQIQKIIKKGKGYAKP